MLVTASIENDFTDLGNFLLRITIARIRCIGKEQLEKLHENWENSGDYKSGIYLNLDRSTSVRSAIWFLGTKQL